MDIPETNPQGQSEVTAENDKGIVWLLKGFIFPAFNMDYYRTATRKRVITAVLFLFLFAGVQTIFITAEVSSSMRNLREEMITAFDSGEFPNITIKDGIAQVDGEQPFIVTNNRQIIAIDTTGVITEIDTTTYSEGALLTKTDIHLVNEDGYQIFPLYELNSSIQNPIIIDKENSLELFSIFSRVLVIASAIGVYIWFFVVRFVYIAMLGILIWGIVSGSRKGIGYDFFLITGIYVNVPAVYLKYLLNLPGLRFFGMFTLIFLVIWIIVIRQLLWVDQETVEDESPVKTDM